MEKQGYKMEYLKILDSAQRSFGQKESYTIVFIAGGIGYMHQEDDNIVCTMEDLIFIKPGNKVKLEYRKNKYPLEVYVLYIGGNCQMKKQDLMKRLILFRTKLRLFILRLNRLCL